MAVEFTRVSGKYSTANGQQKSIPLKIGIDESNPANPPYIVDGNNTNNILYTWNSTTKKWDPTGSKDASLPITLPTGGVAPKYGDFLGINESMFTNNTTAIINKFSDQRKELWYNSNTYQPFNTWRNRQTTVQSSADSASLSLSDENTPDQITGEYKRDWEREEGIYIYPLELRNNNQDYIEFDIIEYKTRRPDASRGNLSFLPRESIKKQKKKIILPIQPSITDSNTVDWNSGQINPVELAAVGLSNQLMNPKTNTDIEDTLGAITSALTLDQNAQKAVRLYLQQKAVGINGLLSRIGGAVLNPNLELLFQGPTLRPFSFNFRLSPRRYKEALEVKQIIRAFKESMSVKTTDRELFLAAPYVYDIRYVNRYDGGSNNHPSINRIKTCVLKSCSVDYTPDGSYMTFNHKSAPMTSYSLSLQFQELEPVTSKDYNMPIEEIGF
jgi:hypothetical protein